MNVLWVCNIALPEASLLLNEEPSPFGGWLNNTSILLSEQEDLAISIAFPKDRLKETKTLFGRKITYYAFPEIIDKDSLSIKENNYLMEIIEKSRPDLVHIFGTELPHTLAVVNICQKMNIDLVISIQGLVSVIPLHYMANLPHKIQKKFTFRDFVRQDNLKQQQNKFINRGKLEIEALTKVKHVIGRTNWDRGCTLQINSNLKYHYCNETLRDAFYKYHWDLMKCEKYSIFVSQGSYPIKGLHFMLEAMPLILKQFPDTMLYIGGPNIIKSDTFKEKLKVSSYGKYIKGLINKYNLHDKVIFTGILDEKEMCERYLKAHVFGCPSSIENSPNSLGEAMLLGVPCVASDVGGISDLLKHKEEGFVYQTDAPYMLAYYICEIFKNEDLAIEFSRKSSTHAAKTHDRAENLKTLINIYKNICSDTNIKI